ncbi:alpha/beta hydrolase [Crocosphaera chwakensis]|uniref:Solute-binding protein family 3/N-terminal domain-containing protein n=1 Tax=Crocosphaera chwakensis CCY0110 TaxID=391612 RepID=A3IJZ3_9CHRO|nr:alpha/beta hydrolase [Crocosphaera chwakensis]EAZ92982.1 hypothetical protein CY0110_02899 [Crocosphaera chwakensis CCY0110]
MNLKKAIQSLLFSVTFLMLLGQGKPMLGAERVVFNLSVLGDFTVSLDSLEEFEKTGEISPDLAKYTNYLDEATLTQFRGLLQKRFPISPVVVSHLTKVGIGKTLLKRVGDLVQMEGNTNGFYALRSSLVLSAADPEGVGIINVLRRFPRQDVRLETDSILELFQTFTALFDYTKTSINAIAQQANQEAAAEKFSNLDQLTDLRNPGQFQFQKKIITFEIAKIRQTNQGLATHYPLEVDFYLPQGKETPSPLVIISHGFGSYQGNYSIAEHLASYGFAVAVPRHIGSDLSYREDFLQGEVRVVLSPSEFVSRPLDIKNLLDELETLAKNNTSWVAGIDLDKVGVLGHSLGGSTAYSLAGANINHQRLAQDCEQKNPLLNSSLFLQCRGSYLPQQNYNLGDERVKAIALAHPLGSSLFGPEEIQKIDIPTLIVGGSQDLVTPVMIEQVHPFIWLNTPKKHLSVMVPGTHFSSTLESDTEGVEGMPKFLIGDNSNLGTAYLKGVSVAFFEAYLNQDDNYLPYLSASYNQQISEEKLTLQTVQSLTPEQLEQAYSETPPVAIIPPLLQQQPTVTVSGSIMERIATTGVLKVALRGDAPPFGYINNEGEWAGYCADVIHELGEYLQENYDIPTEIEVVQLASNLDNRFELVKEKQAYLECGPNTIQNDLSEVSFSNFFFLTGTQFLIKPNNLGKINPFQSLTDVNIGVLENTTTEQFITDKYPRANRERFDASYGRISGIEALKKEQIDVLASDRILLLGEMKRQSLSQENYQLIPPKPLTCEYYGLILPNDDPQWKTVINEFIASEAEAEIWNQWFKSEVSYVLSDLDDCINR